ncbi:MAG: DNA recombination protein RmuC, partial [Gemmatimonadales bacterium]
IRAAGSRVDPVQQELSEIRTRLEGLSTAQQALPRTLAEGAAAQVQSLADVREKLGRLAEATAHLESVGQSVLEVQDLLRVPRLRGTLGEVWLEEILRQVFPSGLYRMQHTFRSGERVDAVLLLGDRLVPIDSKFPLESCQRMLAAEGDAVSQEQKAFRRSLRNRVDEIAERYIRPEEGTVDFAFMYVPAESVYYEAVVRGEKLERQDSVVGYALSRHVIPVSPNTFYAYLAAVLHGLRGLEVEKRARELVASLGGLERQFERFQRAFELVGRHLENAAKQYAESDRQYALVQERLEALTGIEDTPEIERS